jgi:RNA polymerase primary sigma factor
MPSPQDLDAQGEESLEPGPEPENGFPPAEELNELVLDETLEVDRSELAAELSDDPVRLYLREIGQVKLLDASHEFRLAAIIEGRRVVLQAMRHGQTGPLVPNSSATAA